MQPSQTPIGETQSMPRSLTGTLKDYLALTKPRVATLVLFSVAAGSILAALANNLTVDWVQVGWLVLGAALVSSSASAFNQAMEIQTDGLMVRTAKRPLPARRISKTEAWGFGIVTGIVGMAILLTKGDPMGAWVALVTHLSYVLVYTPLKTRTNLNTLIGAIPGALPPVIGYVGVVGHIEPPCAVLFAVLFLWQIPHFLAIAWMYKDQYAGAGMHMLTVKDTSGRATAAQMRNYTLAMMATASFPILIQGRVHGWWDLVYLTGASAVGGWFLWSTILFQKKPCFDTAKIVLRVSLVVLPLLLLLLCLDTWIARSAGVNPVLVSILPSIPPMEQSP